MTEEKISLPYTVGALVRRAWRRALFVRGLKYVEDKSFWDSVFLVEATRAEHHELDRLVDDYKKA